MKAPAFAYARADSLDHALDLLARHGDEARLLAGGQSLMPALNMRLAAPALLIDLNGLGPLGSIRREGACVHIGALARHRSIESSPEVARDVPLLAEAMPHVAHVAIRNRGTFGGSVALADPAAEIPAVTLALDATLLLRSHRGERRVGARDFFRGLYETALAPDEILIGAEFSVRQPHERFAFGEIARRHGDYAVVGLAARAIVEGGTLTGVRLAFLAAGPTARLATHAAAAIEGTACPDEAIAQAKHALARDLDPPADLWFTGTTRLHLAQVLLERVLLRLRPAAA